MASSPTGYYDGSRIFTWISDYTGVSIDQVNFVISQFVALALASLFRTILHPSKTKAATRHGFGLIFGLIIGYFCFGMQAIHLAGLPALCYIVIRTTNPQIMQRLVLAVALIYLSCIHLHRQVYDYGSYSLDITGPLMVVTQKVTSLAFCIHDGICRKESELTKNQLVYAVKNIPTPLEYFSYVLQFPTLMAGPALFYKDYIDFIDGKNFPTPSSNNINNNSGGNTLVLEPSPVRAVCKKVTLSLLCAIAFVKFTPMFHIEGVKDDDFVENTTLMYKFWYLSNTTMLVRFKYYFAWLFADATSNNSGIGFDGYHPDGSHNWDKFSNINMIKFEFGTNLKESIEAWNIGTNRWLRMIVYERVDNYATMLTYGLSALWHGFYPGYYLTFANGALFTFAARSMRRTIRNYFTGNKDSKFIYDVITFVTTRFVMAYITFAFVLLEFWGGIRLYLHMYLCLHILALIALFIVPRVVPKVNPGLVSNHLTANGSIANVLKQASPITNSVSNHHD
ncbi:PREDICTED: lysophospholipid acyltransferase 1 [Nicrophorus vespilloides]|uniref:Lysophospholipid acyltransferase 1 n=1 Tax=Nicrophorus vespilloides TaxID=110193 RepID=A0ABM1MDT7_NICVS|nr:PREDICTED: lysophospholipid acyltransferase 1 [Nicrophorus vespilloides]